MRWALRSSSWSSVHTPEWGNLSTEGAVAPTNTGAHGKQMPESSHARPPLGCLGTDQCGPVGGRAGRGGNGKAVRRENRRTMVAVRLDRGVIMSALPPRRGPEKPQTNKHPRFVPRVHPWVLPSPRPGSLNP